MMDIKHADCRYTRYFCEENIWHLAGAGIAQGTPPRELEVLYFINTSQSVLLLEQRAAPPGMPVVWDYHVVLRARDAQHDRIFDLDTRLAFPQATDGYLRATFPAQQALPAGLRAQVRSIPAAAYLARFRSDRSHMVGHLPASAFPDYPCLTPAPGVAAIDLADYRDPRRRLDDGSTLCHVDDLLAPAAAKRALQPAR
ncbi:MAG: hypothetical protein QNJ91_01900 [Gammaproteobacteria bacterium]|nr:hypothetical protein [Gammaproteobacteria bacterium]